MRITGSPLYSEPHRRVSERFAGSPVTHLIRVCSREYEPCYQRVARLRNNMTTAGTKIHSCDQILAQPERFKSRTLRALIHVSRYLEELGESSADISGLCERVTSNLLSSGEKFDVAKICSSGLGRLVGMKMNTLGFAVHKAIGAVAYCTSTIISVGVIAFAKSKYVRLRNPDEIEQAMQKTADDYSAYLLIARKLLNFKHKHLDKLIHKTESSQNPAAIKLCSWARYLSRNHSSTPGGLRSLRKTNSDYMLNNLQEYGPVTRALMQFSYGTFQGVNKLFVSYDKYIGTALGRRFIAKKTGDMLGCRIALTLSIGTAAAISVPMSPFIIGFSAVGAMACSASLAALLLAKLNVALFNDWKGSAYASYNTKFLAM